MVEGAWQKTFAFAHAKTVYTDYANKKTLADKLSEIDTSLDGKANLSHTHTKSQITDFPTLGTASAKDVASSGNASTNQVVMGNDTRLTDARKASDVSAWAKASVKPSYSKSEVGLGNVDNTSDTSKPVSTAQQTAIDTAYANANKYTDKKVADIIGSAPETMDTLEEVAAAIQENKDVETALNAAIGNKANKTELDTHTGNSTIHITASERTKWNAAKTHADSTHARTDATKVEKSTTNGNIKINGTETTVYTHPSGTNPHGTTKSDIGLGNVGNFKAVSTVSNQRLTDAEKANARTNIGAGTSSFSGSYNDLTNKPTIPTVGNGTVTIKQAGTSKGTFTMNQTGNTTIELTDNNTTYGVATSSALGLIKSGTDITVDSNGNVSVNDDSHNHVISNVDGLQSALDGKAASSHTHNYAGSSSAGGSATSAVKLDSSAGSATQPVYFSGGKPVACTYTLGKSVPSDAVFTDTVYDDTDIKEELTKAIDDIEIGGRNLYLGTKDFIGYWVNKASWYVSSETYKGFTVMKRIGAWSGLSQPIEGVVGETYTFSGYVKKTGGYTYVYAGTDNGGLTTPDSVIIGTKLNEWEHFSFTSTISTSGLLAFRVENSLPTETTYVCGLKLEKGNKATDWMLRMKWINLLLS